MPYGTLRQKILTIDYNEIYCLPFDFNRLIGKLQGNSIDKYIYFFGEKNILTLYKNGIK